MEPNEIYELMEPNEIYAAAKVALESETSAGEKANTALRLIVALTAGFDTLLQTLRPDVPREKDPI